VSTRGGRNDQLADQLTTSVEPLVAAAGYDLEELVVRAAGQRSVVRVVIDRDEGVSLDDVAELSHSLSDVLDAQDASFGGSAYVLEVTSPGVDRPLTQPRHWRRNVGRLVAVAAGPAGRQEQLTGRVVRVTDEGVVLAVEKGAAKKGQVRRATQERTLAWAELGEARVQVEFARPAGHRDAGLVHLGDPDDGADDGDDDDGDDDDESDDVLLDEQDEQDTVTTAPDGGTGRPVPPRAPRQRRGGTQ
jgi:ribosome maturation factor RimP